MKGVKSFSILFSLRFTEDYLGGGKGRKLYFLIYVQDVLLLLNSGKFVE